MALVLRSAVPDDAETVHRLIVALATYEHETAAVENTPDTLRAQLAAPHPPFECLLAETDGEALGFALFFQTYSTWVGRPGIWLEDLFVQEAHRGLGIGRALLTRVAQLAVERGFGRLEWSVLDWNAPALAFYERLGAANLDTWRLHRLAGDALGSLADRS